MTTLDHVSLCQNVFTHVSFSLSLELAGIEHKVQAGMFVSQIFKSVCTSEHSDQSLSFPNHFLPIKQNANERVIRLHGWAHMSTCTFCWTQAQI